jgi:hypothetical protein
MLMRIILMFKGIILILLRLVYRIFRIKQISRIYRITQISRIYRIKQISKIYRITQISRIYRITQIPKITQISKTTQTSKISKISKISKLTQISNPPKPCIPQSTSTSSKSSNSSAVPNRNTVAVRCFCKSPKQWFSRKADSTVSTMSRRALWSKTKESNLKALSKRPGNSRLRLSISLNGSMVNLLGGLWMEYIAIYIQFILKLKNHKYHKFLKNHKYHKKYHKFLKNHKKHKFLKNHKYHKNH